MPLTDLIFPKYGVVIYTYPKDEKFMWFFPHTQRKTHFQLRPISIPHHDQNNISEFELNAEIFLTKTRESV